MQFPRFRKVYVKPSVKKVGFLNNKVNEDLKHIFIIPIILHLLTKLFEDYVAYLPIYLKYQRFYGF